ncbi:hypothetical protein, partial [Klebsiella pneumoniae]
PFIEPQTKPRHHSLCHSFGGISEKVSLLAPEGHVSSLSQSAVSHVVFSMSGLYPLLVKL